MDSEQPQKYTPSQEELEKAEGMMSPTESKLSKGRESRSWKEQVKPRLFVGKDAKPEKKPAGIIQWVKDSGWQKGERTELRDLEAEGEINGQKVALKLSTAISNNTESGDFAWRVSGSVNGKPLTEAAANRVWRAYGPSDSAERVEELHEENKDIQIAQQEFSERLSIQEEEKLRAESAELLKSIGL